jgi:methylthioribose-1-phosphate isomerase
MSRLQAIRYRPGKLEVLDQLRLPHEHHYDNVSTCEEAFDCIKSMRVRGAPAIAIVASLALAVELHYLSPRKTSPTKHAHAFSLANPLMRHDCLDAARYNFAH